MGRKYQIISGDGHVETPPDGWLAYVPEQYRDRAPRLIRLPNGSDGWLVEGQPMLHNGQNIKGRGPVKFANASSAARRGFGRRHTFPFVSTDACSVAPVAITSPATLST